MALDTNAVVFLLTGFVSKSLLFLSTIVTTAPLWFYCTASGKTYLASLSKKIRNAMLDTMDLKPLTKNTLFDKNQLLVELEQISKQGYAIDREEFIEGMVAMAVPIFDSNGRFHAAVAFHGPTVRLTIDSLSDYYVCLRDAADKLGRIIFQKNN